MEVIAANIDSPYMQINIGIGFDQQMSWMSNYENNQCEGRGS
jgi:hypothetical protein